MTRPLAIVLLWVGLAAAQSSTTRTYLPEFPDGGANAAFGSANVLTCFGEVPTQGITNATKIGWAMTGGVGGGGLCGWAIYDATGASRLVTTGAANCSGTGGVLASGLAAFTLVKGTKYQVCGCSSAGGGSYFGADPGASSGVQLLQNGLATPLASTAANACTAGAPPTTTGLLTPATASFPHLVLGTNTP